MIQSILSNPEIIKYMSLIITLIIGLLIKDVASNLVSGVLFYLDKNFNDGDTVYIDGYPAIIIKIGIRTTVFGITNSRGYTWRFVQNSKVSELSLEKIVINSEIQALPNIQRRLYDLESFLEKTDAEFKKRIDAREEKENEEELYAKSQEKLRD